MSDEKVSAVAPVAHESDPSKTHPDVIDHARSAADKEQKMTLMQGIKLYPKAVGWSILISTCIVMEGFDIVLVNNFCKFYWSSLRVAVTDHRN
jgi:SP family general alpha glucoside:H+ symporter-like MFS transporter